MPRMTSPPVGPPSTSTHPQPSPALGAPAGCGIILALLNDGSDKVVHALSPGGPADMAGIRVGDIVVTIDGRVVTDLPLETAADLCRGEYGSEALIGLRRPNSNGVMAVIVTRGFITSPARSDLSSSAPLPSVVPAGVSTPGSGLGLVLAEDGPGAPKYVQSLISNGPAANAGVQMGDGVVTVDGVRVLGLTLDQAASLCRGPVGTTCALGVRRGGHPEGVVDIINVTRGMVAGGVTPGSIVVPQQQQPQSSGLGIVLVELADGQKVIDHVAMGSPAAIVGLGVGDTVMAIDNVDVSSASLDVTKQLAKGPPGSRVVLVVQRRGFLQSERIGIVRSELPSGQNTPAPPSGSTTPRVLRPPTTVMSPVSGLPDLVSMNPAPAMAAPPSRASVPVSGNGNGNAMPSRQSLLSAGSISTESVNPADTTADIFAGTSPNGSARNSPVSQLNAAAARLSTSVQQESAQRQTSPPLPVSQGSSAPLPYSGGPIGGVTVVSTSHTSLRGSVTSFQTQHLTSSSSSSSSSPHQRPRSERGTAGTDSRNFVPFPGETSAIFDESTNKWVSMPKGTSPPLPNIVRPKVLLHSQTSSQSSSPAANNAANNDAANRQNQRDAQQLAITEVQVTELKRSLAEKTRAYDWEVARLSNKVGQLEHQLQQTSLRQQSTSPERGSQSAGDSAIHELRAALAREQAQNGELRRELDRAVSGAQRAAGDVASMQGDIGALQQRAANDLSAMKQRAEHAEQEAQALRSQLDSVSNGTEQTRHEAVQSLMATVEDLRTKLAAAERNTADAIADAKAAAAAAADQRLQHGRGEDELARLEEHIKSLRQELDDERQKAAQAQADAEMTVAAAKALHDARVAELEAAIHDISGASRVRDEEVQARANRAEASVAELQGRLSGCEATIVTLRAEAVDGAKLRHASEARLTERLREAEEEAASVLQRYSNLMKDHERLLDNQGNNSTAASELELRNASLKDEVAQLQQQTAQHRATETRLENSVAQLRELLGKEQQRAAEAVGELSAVRSTQGDVSMRADRLQTQLNEERAANHESMEEAERRIAEIQHKYVSLLDQNRIQVSADGKDQSSLQSMEAKLRAAIGEAEGLRVQVVEATDKTAEAHRRARTLQSEVETLQRDVTALRAKAQAQADIHSSASDGGEASNLERKYSDLTGRFHQAIAERDRAIKASGEATEARVRAQEAHNIEMKRLQDKCADSDANAKAITSTMEAKIAAMRRATESALASGALASGDASSDNHMLRVTLMERDREISELRLKLERSRGDLRPEAASATAVAQVALLEQQLEAKDKHVELLMQHVSSLSGPDGSPHVTPNAGAGAAPFTPVLSRSTRSEQPSANFTPGGAFAEEAMRLRVAMGQLRSELEQKETSRRHVASEAERAIRECDMLREKLAQSTGTTPARHVSGSAHATPRDAPPNVSNIPEPGVYSIQVTRSQSPRSYSPVDRSHHEGTLSHASANHGDDELVKMASPAGPHTTLPPGGPPPSPPLQQPLPTRASPTPANAPADAPSLAPTGDGHLDMSRMKLRAALGDLESKSRMIALLETELRSQP